MSLAWPLNVPVLSDGFVTLRAHTHADLDDVHAMGVDPVTQRWTSIPLDHTIEDSEKFVLGTIPRGWDDGTARGWAIEVEGRFAGNIDVRGAAPITDVGFALHPWARGRGAMTAALRLAVDWCFTEGGVEVVHWHAHVGNEASLRVAHAAGFTLNGLIPGLLNERGRVLDGWSATVKFGDSPEPRTRWAEPTAVEGDQVGLRPMHDDDLPRVVEACSDPLTRHWLAGLPSPYTLASAREYVASCVWQAALGNKATWAVADRATDDLVGMVTVMDMKGASPETGEIGYWAHPDARGRGVTTEAVGLVIRHAFDPAGLDRQRLTLFAGVDNRSSTAIARHHGFRHLGTQRRAERLGDGALVDLDCFELLR